MENTFQSPEKTLKIKNKIDPCDLKRKQIVLEHGKFTQQIKKQSFKRLKKIISQTKES